ncbi:UNVERIFIED_CONTAM: uncharacterized protein (DUF2225 family) [Brevibacillus sp. OAP136]
MAINLDALFDRKWTCHACETTFVSQRVRSNQLQLLKRDSDFCTHYKEQRLNPILYTVTVCPSCGYSFTDQFSNYLPPHVKKRIQDNITSKWTPKEFGGIRGYEEAIASYKLAIYTAILKEEAYCVKAGLYLRLAWLYRFVDKPEEEQRFLQLSVGEYEKSFTHSDFVNKDKDMSETRMLYLIGELMRRIGQYDKAILYFSKTVEMKNRTIESGIINMARDQWSIAREEYKAKKAASLEMNEAQSS